MFCTCDTFFTCTIRACGSRFYAHVDTILCAVSKTFHPHAMSLLNIPTFSSFCSTPPPTWKSSPATPPGIRPTNARLRLGVGRLAIWSIPLHAHLFGPCKKKARNGNTIQLCVTPFRFSQVQAADDARESFGRRVRSLNRVLRFRERRQVEPASGGRVATWGFGFSKIQFFWEILIFVVFEKKCQKRHTHNCNYN